MINITLNEKDYSIKNKLNEFTIGEFEIISTILNNPEFDKIDKYSKIFVTLGIEQEVIDNLDVSDFFKIIKEFTNIDDDINYLTNEKIREIEIDGRIYRSYEGETFKMNVKQMKYIEKYIKINPTSYISDLMSVIFKDIQLTDNEHYVDAHLKHKSKLFKTISIDKALPYVGFFSSELLSNIKLYASL